MDPKVKISAAALAVCCCVLLAMANPLWLWGTLIGALALLKYALDAVGDSETDPLTGLWNLRRLERRRRRYWRCLRLTVLYLDLDDLKQINDTQGHGAGSAALQEVARTLLDADDGAYRIGGDEFLLISKDMDEAELTSCWKDAAEHLTVRVSWGTAHGPGTELDELIRRAEQNMYQNK